MLERTRFGLFVLGLVCTGCALLVELGSRPILARGLGAPDDRNPGLGILYVGVFDLLLGYTLFLLASEFVPGWRALLARVQAVATFLLSLVAVLAGLLMAWAALTLLSLMLALLLSLPFGPGIYALAWGTFPTGISRLLLGLTMNLKLGGLLLIVLAQPTLLRNRGLVLLAATSLGATALVGLLHAWPAGFLVSLTDAVAALLVALAFILWGALHALRTLPAALLGLRHVAARG